MTEDDDKLLADYDLSAWEAPPPPRGLADAVIARAKQPAGAAAIEPESRPVRRWWIGGAIAAVVAAGAAFAVWGSQRAPKDGGGDVLATVAQTLELGPSTAHVDHDTELHWRREKHRVTVAQPRGAAIWRVSEDDTFVIDAGATVASVEATGASLRVEVKVNLSEARVIGASAVTAAVVSMVTVIVYEGRVKVTSGGQTVTVQPGATLELRGNAPAPADPISVGASTSSLEQKIEEQQREIEKLRAMTGDTTTIAANEIDRVLAPLIPVVTKCLEGVAELGTVNTKISVTAAGDVAEVTTDIPSAFGGNDQCVRTSISSQKFPTTQRGAVVAYAFPIDNKAAPKPADACDEVSCGLNNYQGACCQRFKPAKPPAKPVAACDEVSCVLDDSNPACCQKYKKSSCDFDGYVAKGDDAYDQGMPAAALAHWEKALSCKTDLAIVKKAAMAACNTKNVAKARAYIARVPESQQAPLFQICVRNGITTDQVSASSCDAEALRQKGEDHLASGMDAAALAAFESSLRCKADPRIERIALMAACRSKNAASAKRHYANLPASASQTIVQICVRAGISVDDPGPADAETGTLKVSSKPPARVIVDGVDTGKTTPATLQLAPGRHKVTFQIGVDKYTFATLIKAGETERMVKDLSAP